MHIRKIVSASTLLLSVDHGFSWSWATAGYQTPDSVDEDEEKEFGKRTSVHDKQAWLSNAFVKKQSNGVVMSSSSAAAAAASPKDEEVTMKSDPIVTLAKSEPIGMPAKVTKMKKTSVGVK